MPWTVERESRRRWAIVRSDTGEVVGHSSSKEKAMASVRARYAHSRDVGKAADPYAGYASIYFPTGNGKYKRAVFKDVETRNRYLARHMPRATGGRPVAKASPRLAALGARTGARLRATGRRAGRFAREHPRATTAAVGAGYVGAVAAGKYAPRVVSAARAGRSLSWLKANPERVAEAARSAPKADRRVYRAVKPTAQRWGTTFTGNKRIVRNIESGAAVGGRKQVLLHPVKEAARRDAAVIGTLMGGAQPSKAPLYRGVAATSDEARRLASGGVPLRRIQSWHPDRDVADMYAGSAAAIGRQAERLTGSGRSPVRRAIGGAWLKTRSARSGQTVPTVLRSEPGVESFPIGGYIPAHRVGGQLRGWQGVEHIARAGTRYKGAD